MSCNVYNDKSPLPGDSQFPHLSPPLIIDTDTVGVTKAISWLLTPPVSPKATGWLLTPLVRDAAKTKHKFSG